MSFQVRTISGRDKKRVNLESEDAKILNVDFGGHIYLCVACFFMFIYIQTEINVIYIYI